MSGTPVNVVVFVAKLTFPFRVRANGGGKVMVMAGAARVPVRYTLPVSGLG
jgi:hypothetical protein